MIYYTCILLHMVLLTWLILICWHAAEHYCTPLHIIPHNFTSYILLHMISLYLHTLAYGCVYLVKSWFCRHAVAHYCAPLHIIAMQVYIMHTITYDFTILAYFCIWLCFTGLILIYWHAVAHYCTPLPYNFTLCILLHMLSLYLHSCSYGCVYPDNLALVACCCTLLYTITHNCHTICIMHTITHDFTMRAYFASGCVYLVNLGLLAFCCTLLCPITYNCHTIYFMHTMTHDFTILEYLCIWLCSPG